MNPLNQLRWPSLAQDLAVMMSPDSPITDMSSIYETYGLNKEQLSALLTVPQFQTLYQEALATFKQQGSAAGLIYRSKQLSMALAEELFRTAMDREMEPRDSLKLLELLMKASGQFTPETQVNTQVNVGLTLPLPKLKNKKINHIKELEEKRS